MANALICYYSPYPDQNILRDPLSRTPALKKIQTFYDNTKCKLKLIVNLWAITPA